MNCSLRTLLWCLQEAARNPHEGLLQAIRIFGQQVPANRCKRLYWTLGHSAAFSLSFSQLRTRWTCSCNFAAQQSSASTFDLPHRVTDVQGMLTRQEGASVEVMRLGETVKAHLASSVDTTPGCSVFVSMREEAGTRRASSNVNITLASLL